MGIHASGDGAAWDSLENLDVDQPHGLDYRESVHLAKAVRKRLDQEHTTFADSTAGGIHMPGGVAVLGMELTDDGGDITAVVVGDGTYRARGLVWAWDGSADARLWCSTKAAGNSTTGDWTLLALHPDKQWGGRDVTWSGAHEFDSSVDITGPLWVDSSSCFSDVQISGDLTVAGIIKTATDISVSGDIAVDGTSNFTGDIACAADISATGYVKADGTTSAFGEGVGVELYWDPTSFSGAVSKESITLPNSVIMKQGNKVKDDNNATDVSFAVAFPNGITSINVTPRHTDSMARTPTIKAYATTGFTVDYDEALTGIFWQAIGY